MESCEDIVKAFEENAQLHAPVFLEIGESTALYSIDHKDYPQGTESDGVVLPRMFVALTRNGSIVGLFGHVVHT